MNVTMPGTTNQEEFTPNALEKLVSLVNKIEFDSTQIMFGHPSDLFKMDMNKFSPFCYFISHHDVEQGTLLLVKDADLKKTLYDFVKNNPDRVFRGKQGLNETQ